MESKKFNEFKVLYQQFLAGMRWLNSQMARGINVDKDKQEFEAKVVGPMDALWSTFTNEEKDYWLKVDKVVKVFDGKIKG